MPCNECNDYVNPCTKCNDTPCPDGDNSCNCVQKDMSTDCIVYTGDDLECSGILQNTVLTVLIQQLTTFICNKFEETIQYLTLVNIGSGAEVFAGISGIGSKKLRSIVSEDLTLLDVVQNSDTIGVKAGTHRLELNGNNLSVIVNTNQGDTVLSVIDLTKFTVDTFVQDTQFNESNQELLLDMNIIPDHIVDLSFLNNHLESVGYNSGTNSLNFTITDGTVFPVDITSILGNSQNQSDYLENNTSSPSHIFNRNPSKTEVLGASGTYTVLVSDNNFIIEIDNGANDVTINLTGIVATTDFFVGFVQKGTGIVTFIGADVIPQDLTNMLYGQGHVCAMEVIGNSKYLVGQLQFA